MVEKVKSENNELKSFKHVLKDAFKELNETFIAFVKAPRALWGINVPYILEGLVYFGILTILGKYCSENVGLNDVYAGWIYGGVTGGITFAMLILGGVVDRIGVRTSLALALGTMTVGRLLISLSGTLPLGSGLGSPMFFLMISGLLLMVAAYGLYQPAAYAGVKRYTNPQTAAMGYAVIYALMNLGAFIFGPISSFTRRHFENTFPPNGLAAVFWVLTAITFLATVLTLIIITKKVDRRSVERIKRETQEMQAKKDKSIENKENTFKDSKIDIKKINNTPFLILTLIALMALIFFIASVLHKIQLSIYTTSAVFLVTLIAAGWEYLRRRPDHPFRDIRFVFFIFILIPVQTLFAHNWLTIPYYLDRAFRGTWVSQNFEILSNLNPIIIFFITPVIAGLTARANVYKMMIIGTFVMAAPTFLLAAGPYAIPFVLYIIIMSIGEAIWQPRFLQWIAEIAPKGKTGAYMGIGQFPWFLTKLITASYSGYFIAHYVPKPESGLPMRTGKMWLIYALIAMVSPVTLWFARKWMMSGMKKNN